jgi:hypothetical protein
LCKICDSSVSFPVIYPTNITKANVSSQRSQLKPKQNVSNTDQTVQNPQKHKTGKTNKMKDRKDGQRRRERHENKPNVIPQDSFPYAQIWHPPFQIILATIHKSRRPKNTKAIHRPLHPSITYSPPLRLVESLDLSRNRVSTSHINPCIHPRRTISLCPRSR